MSKAVLVNAEVVHSYLRREGMTMKDLAEKMGLTPDHLRKVLHRQSSPSLEMILGLEAATGIPWWRFMLPANVTVVPMEDKEALDALRRALTRDLVPA